MSAERHVSPAELMHERAIAHRAQALRAVAEPTTAALLVALTHAILALEARVEEMTELMPR